jgi:hypothetical protein
LTQAGRKKARQLALNGPDHAAARFSCICRAPASWDDASKYTKAASDQIGAAVILAANAAAGQIQGLLTP